MVEKSNYDLHGIRVTIVQKKMKNLYLKVRPPMGEVVVSAPLFLSLQDIHSHLHLRYEWILQQQEKIRQLPLPLPKQFISGECHFLWGKAYSLQRRNSRRIRASLEGDDLVIYAPHNAQAPILEKALDHLYRLQLQEKIPTMIDRWQGVMEVDVWEWRVRKMKTRWGTCNTRDHRVWISLELAKHPLACLEYVVVHELAHLLERSHNDRFWRLMDGFLPQWPQIRTQLNSGII